MAIHARDAMQVSMLAAAIALVPMAARAAEAPAADAVLAMYGDRARRCTATR